MLKGIHLQDLHTDSTKSVLKGSLWKGACGDKASLELLTVCLMFQTALWIYHVGMDKSLCYPSPLPRLLLWCKSQILTVIRKWLWSVWIEFANFTTPTIHADACNCYNIPKCLSDFTFASFAETLILSKDSAFVPTILIPPERDDYQMQVSSYIVFFEIEIESMHLFSRLFRFPKLKIISWSRWIFVKNYFKNQMWGEKFDFNSYDGYFLQFWFLPDILHF